MARTSFLAAVSVLALTASAARADTVSVAFTNENTAPGVLQPTSVTGADAAIPFATNINVAGDSIGLNGDLTGTTYTNSQTFNSTSNANIRTYASFSPAASPASITGTFTANLVSAANQIVVEQVYGCNSGTFCDGGTGGLDGNVGGGVLLTSQRFDGSGSPGPVSGTVPFTLTITSPFTAFNFVYEDFSTGGGSSTGTVSMTVTPPVPVAAPIAGAGIPGLLAALGGLWMLARRRHRQ